jgi:hypothetical protein
MQLEYYSESMGLKTFVFSNLWYRSQIIPPDNLHIEKIKKTIGNFLWSGFICKLDRRQLCLSPEKECLALINVELKLKAFNLFEELIVNRNKMITL